jgi:MYXO-CTERM domain-containing protein
VHVAFVNLGDTDAVLSRLFVTSVPSEDLDEGSPEGREPEDEGTDTATGSDDTDAHGNSTGKAYTSPCTCRAGGDPSQAVLLAVLPWLWRRRRRGSGSVSV